MDPERLKKYADVALLIMQAFGVGVAQVQAVFTLLRPGATDDEMNEIIRSVQDDARIRKAISDKEVADAEAASGS